MQLQLQARFLLPTFGRVLYFVNNLEVFYKHRAGRISPANEKYKKTEVD